MEGVVNRTSWKASVEGLLNRSLGFGGALSTAPSAGDATTCWGMVWYSPD